MSLFKELDLSSLRFRPQSVIIDQFGPYGAFEFIDFSVNFLVFTLFTPTFTSPLKKLYFFTNPWRDHLHLPRP